MSNPDTIPPTAPPGRRTGWLALTASQRGAAHVATKLPNQDAVIAQEAGLGGVVAAVADGHGHWRHARSARGSLLAVTIGCQIGQELAGQLHDNQAFPAAEGEPDAPPVTSQIGDLVRDGLIPDIVRRWREAVLADVAADPFTAEEQEARQDGDDPTIAYGSTLLLAVAVRQWLVLAQIGDGDIVGVRADGAAVLPVPDDPQLDGRYTTSLCGPDARSDFRAAVVDTDKAPLAAVMLASDGYGNAQIADQWTDAFSKDLAEMIRERDDQWLASQLPMWAARCASADGSADDTTVALLLGPPGQNRTVATDTKPGGLTPDIGSEETTVPAVIHAPTVPNTPIPTGHGQTAQGSSPAQGPIEPITVRLAAIEPEITEPVSPVEAMRTIEASTTGTSTTGTSTAAGGQADDVTVEASTVEASTVEASTVEASTVEASTVEASTVAGSTVAGGQGAANREPGSDEPDTVELAATRLSEGKAAAGKAAVPPDSQETAPWPGDR
jgi:hypothetical protein